MTSTITERGHLENHFGDPKPSAVAVMRKSLDQYQRQFIELSPFACIATANGEGQPTISPRGDTPGFIRVIDERTLLMPDRVGNNKVESFHNIVENPKVGIIFMIPGVRETLRVSGEAGITTDQDLLENTRVGVNPVRTGLRIHITKVYFHCGKAMIRSKLWDEKSKLAKGVLPSFGEIIKAEAKMEDSIEELDGMLEEAYKNNLY